MATYTDAKLSNFPDKIDDLPRLSDVSANTIGKMNQYNSLMASGDFTGANEMLDNELAQCLFTADDYNKLRDAIIAVERTFKDDITSVIQDATKVINDTATNDTTKQITTYSSYKIDNLLSDAVTSGALPVIDANSNDYDMDAIIKGKSHLAIYRTNKDTLNTPYQQYVKGDTSIGNYTRAAILSYGNGSGYGIQIAYRQGCMPAYRTISSGTLSTWSNGYVRLNGNSTVNGTITATGFKGNLDGNADTATKLKTARTIQVDLSNTKSSSFDGSGNVTPGVKGILPAKYGGTGQTSIDTTPTEGSKTMVTSGGVYSALDKKVSKTGGEVNAITGDLWVKQASYPGVILTETTNKSKVSLENYGTAAVMSVFDNYEDESNKNKRRFILRDSSSANHPKLSEALALHDYYYDSDGKEHDTYYNLFGEHNVELINGNTIINGLIVGDSVPKDTDYFISQYVSGNEETTTASTKNNYFRRPFSLLWDYIKNKLNEAKVTLASGLSVSKGVTITGGLTASGGTIINNGLVVNNSFKTTTEENFVNSGLGRIFSDKEKIQLEAWNNSSTDNSTTTPDKQNRTMVIAHNVNSLEMATYVRRIRNNVGQNYMLYGTHNVTSGTAACSTDLPSGCIYLQYD